MLVKEGLLRGFGSIDFDEDPFVLVIDLSGSLLVSSCAHGLC
jgi:hypothetical protein